MNKDETIYSVLLSQDEQEAIRLELDIYVASIKDTHEVEWLQKGDERPIEITTVAEQSLTYDADNSKREEPEEDSEEEVEDFIAFMIISVGAKLMELKKSLHYVLLFLDWYETDWLIDHLNFALEVYAMEKTDSKDSRADVFTRADMLEAVPTKLYLENNVASARAKLVEAFAQQA
ncbi:MAG TPA: hypothetical protein VMX33_13095 [bacterium]|nr:hypothetical protein [bacterium]